MSTSGSTNRVSLGAGLSVYSCLMAVSNQSFLFLQFFLLVMLVEQKLQTTFWLIIYAMRAAVVSFKYIQKVTLKV